MPELTVKLPDELMRRLQTEAEKLGTTVEQRTIAILEQSVAQVSNMRPSSNRAGLARLYALLESIPAVDTVAVSEATDPYWWAKFTIDIESPIAWHVVQELGSLLNYLSLTERPPTVFKPVSPPPYMNGGPDEYLSWVIEATLPFADARYVAELLKGRLPDPIDDEDAWLETSDEEDEDDEDDEEEE
ncbi:MAG: hypothetical protein ABI670_12865 [Chloroflexota bacterium]